MVVISRRWSICVVVVVLVATSLLAIITLKIQVKMLQWINKNFHLVDWGRGKVDGREVAVLGQRVGCCYLRLKEGI